MCLHLYVSNKFTLHRMFDKLLLGYNTIPINVDYVNDILKEQEILLSRGLKQKYGTYTSTQSIIFSSASFSSPCPDILYRASTSL